jgi:glycosyltransferase involved in cell wall biosynthesis
MKSTSSGVRRENWPHPRGCSRGAEDQADFTGRRCRPVLPISNGFMKMRVLQVINGEFFSGAERVQDVLALRLPDYGVEPGFACIKPDKFPSRRTSTVPLYETPMKSKFDLAPARAIARIVRQEKYALIHTHSPRAALVGRVASWLAGVPMVHHVHSPTSRDTESAMRNRLNSLMERASLTGVARLIPVSRSLHGYLRGQGWPETRISTVPNGVPTPGPLPEREAPAGEWVIGCMALYRPRKGVEVLIEALAMLRRAGRKARLRAVGPFETPEYEASIRALAQRLEVTDSIDWTGFTSNVNAEFAKMDVFVLPSLFGEGMPMVILEAMAVGVPVVASDVEGIPEVLEHGRSGLVVPPNDPGALADEIGRLMEAGYNWMALRKKAYERQADGFSDRSMAKGVAAAYAKVLGHE